MTAISEEAAVSSSAPIELYTFLCDTDTRLFTSSEKPFSSSEGTYEPVTLVRSALEDTQETFGKGLTLDVAISFPLLKEYHSSYTVKKWLVTVQRYQRESGTKYTIFTGWWSATSFPKDHTAVLTISPLASSIASTVLRLHHQLLCPHRLYDPDSCGAESGLWSEQATLTAVSGNVYTSPQLDKDAGYYAGGKLMFTAGGVTIQRMILDSSQSRIRVSLRIPGIGVGSVVTVFAGCNRTIQTCNDKFNNAVNYGGEPWIPDKQPFLANIF